VHLFYDIQSKRIRGIPFIVKSHNNRQQIKMHRPILNQVQVNLIYNTNGNLFLWIEILICTTDLYNATTDRWSCHLPNRNVCATQMLPMGVERSVPLLSDIKGTELPPADILNHSKGNWLRYNFAADSFYIMKLCSRLFVLHCRSCPKDDKFRYLIPVLRKLGAA